MRKIRRSFFRDRTVRTVASVVLLLIGAWLLRNQTKAEVAISVVGVALLCGLAWLAWRNRKRLHRYKFAGRHWTRENLMQLTGHEFEGLVGQVYRELGYRVRENPHRSADGGIDLIIDRDGERLVVQCKRWQQPVSVKGVRELWGVKHAMRASGAIFVTTATFTSAARSWGTKAGVVLVDGTHLLRTIETLSTARPRT